MRLRPSTPRVAVLAALALACACNRRPAYLSAVDDLRNHAQHLSNARDTVRSLTDEVGPRLAGSARDPDAVAWAVRAMRARGLANVRPEPVTAPHWERGVETGEVLAPFPHRLALTALGGSVPTAEGGLEADVVEVESLDALGRLAPDAARGKVVLINRPTVRARDGHGYGDAVPGRVQGAARAAALGAVGVLVRSVGSDVNRLPHTGYMHYEDGAPRIPAAALSVPDAALLHHLLATGQPVRVRMTLGCQLLPDVQTFNVVGEVPGDAYPEQVVLLGAHLDSWDLGTGALDDGAGCAIVLEAARLIRGSAQRPRRTVRVVLFANEENGGAGARGYAAAHASELANHVLAMEADAGDGRVWGARLPAGLGARPVYGQLLAVLAPLGIEYAPRDAHGGADVGPLLASGVPVLDLCQDMTRYFDAHHSANDMLEQVHGDELDQAVAAFATAAYLAAQTPEDLGRVAPHAAHE